MCQITLYELHVIFRRKDYFRTPTFSTLILDNFFLHAVIRKFLL